MRIINVIINMDDIKQERSDEGPNLKLNKRFNYKSLRKKLDTHVKESMALQALEK